MSYIKLQSRNFNIPRAFSSGEVIYLDTFWDDCQSNRRMNKMHSFLCKYDETYNVSKSKKKKNNSVEYSNWLYQRAMIQHKIKKEKCHYNIELKKKNELDKCTWKPRLNKLTLQQKMKLEIKGNDIYERELNRQREKWKLRQKSASQEGKCRSVFIIDYDVKKKIDNGPCIKNVRR